MKIGYNTFMKTLSDKQKLFVEEYVKDRNATQAAIRAGYSKKTANNQVTQIMNEDVKMAIELKLCEMSVRNDLTADRVIKEYMKLAFYDTDEFYHVYYSLKTYLKGHRRAKRRFGYKLTPEEFSSLPAKYRQYYDRIKTLKDLGDIPEHHRKAIVGISYDKNNNMVLKLADKTKALDSLSKHLGLFEADNKQSRDVVPTTWNVNIIKPGDDK